ncbi:DNA-3-methyladenine glycosylase [Actinomarinicola tropica]|uniref:Putative 3-methyladenine DNA glycosylase n=1 Tax=Actinomarinicola tropica TaxID=2789776 RepID=A0A5Q2RPZ2_9ACTN|nr:DNA-3-methyladenine glycosylase [Actinomarinicola tropica]
MPAHVARLGRPVERSRLARPAVEVAPELLGTVLVAGDRAGRIVEVEAYMGEADPGSHAFRGPTARTATMFGPPGHLYVYFTYGMHWCANVVCGDDGVASAALIRALEPLRGVEAMREARPAARRDRDLCNGPAKLCQALGLDGRHDGTDVVRGTDDVWLLEDGWTSDAAPVVSTRIGLTNGADLPWRWHVDGSAHVSRPSGRGGIVVG